MGDIRYHSNVCADSFMKKQDDGSYAEVYAEKHKSIQDLLLVTDSDGSEFTCNVGTMYLNKSSETTLLPYHTASSQYGALIFKLNGCTAETFPYKYVIFIVKDTYNSYYAYMCSFYEFSGQNGPFYRKDAKNQKYAYASKTISTDSFTTTSYVILADDELLYAESPTCQQYILFLDSDNDVSKVMSAIYQTPQDISILDSYPDQYFCISIYEGRECTEFPKITLYKFDAGDVPFDATETYKEGSIGQALANMSSSVDSVTESSATPTITLSDYTKETYITCSSALTSLAIINAAQQHEVTIHFSVADATTLGADVLPITISGTTPYILGGVSDFEAEAGGTYEISIKNGVLVLGTINAYSE